jgi:uncharacterized protein
VIAVDTNLLVYAHREDSPWHNTAYKCVRELAEGKSTWSIPWPSIHEFLAIVTHPRIYSPPTPLARAVDQVAAWFESPSLFLLTESEGYWNQLLMIINSSRVTGAIIHDARIVALCLLHGVDELWSADRDFSRFPKLTVRNPLVQD